MCIRDSIYVGYRYFETFARDKVKYPFGFGLSYTRFQTESMGLAVQGTEATVIEKVTNVGGMSGRETIQVYVEAPQGKLGKPLRQLAAYAKTEELKPGASEELILKAELTELASYDDSGVTCLLYTSHQVKLLIDEEVLDSEYFGCHPCINTSSLRMRTADLIEKVLPAMEHDFVKVKL